jgi:hypothetical protein
MRKLYICILISMLIIATMTIDYVISNTDNDIDNNIDNNDIDNNIDNNDIDNNIDSNDIYPLHENITVTIFWIGEEGTQDNGYIPNNQSAWDSNWEDHYGGIDDPYNRTGNYPKDFIPRENPFYFALPYNDFDENGKKLNVSRNGSVCRPICKNTWVMIIKGDKVAYAQWEDVGPFGEKDVGYVFGMDKPKNSINNAGLDVSPAVRDYLELEDVDKVDWRFIDFKDIPMGPWLKIITRSDINWS